MECQYVATQRGGVALVFEGHRYNKVRDGKDGTVYWRCSRDRQCPGRAVTVNNRVKKANNKHNHPPEASLRNGSVTSSTSSPGNSATSGTTVTGLGTVVSSNSSSVAQSEPPALILPSSLAIQNVLDAQTAAAAAAVSFPAIVTETLKYLAVASGNHQMAAFASSMASLSSPSLKNLDRAMGRTPTSFLTGGLHTFSSLSLYTSLTLRYTQSRSV